MLEHTSRLPHPDGFYLGAEVRHRNAIRFSLLQPLPFGYAFMYMFLHGNLSEGVGAFLGGFTMEQARAFVGMVKDEVHAYRVANSNIRLARAIVQGLDRQDTEQQDHFAHEEAHIERTD